MTSFKTTKMKITAILASVALIATIGTGAALAANDNKVETLVSDSDGTRYTTDGGATWKDESQIERPSTEGLEEIEVKDYTINVTDGGLINDANNEGVILTDGIVIDGDVEITEVK